MKEYDLTTATAETINQLRKAFTKDEKMIKDLFSIADKKSNIFLPPFLAHNNEDAQRQILTMMQKEQNMISMYPEDYTLMKIGTFDDSVGLIDALPIPQIVVNINALVQSFKESKNDGNTGTPDKE